jgi:TolB protein
VLRRPLRVEAVGGERVVWTLAVVPALVALSVVGLLHGPSRHVTPLGSADGIAFAYAPEGTSHIYVTSGTELVQVTNGHGSDLAPAWSPDHRRIAFQSSRDGNWEIYVANADGSDVRRLTDDDARDGEPSWSPDGKRIVFVRDGHLFEMRSDGGGVHTLGNDGEWPSWASDGKSLASDVEFGGHHGIVASAPGRSVGQYGAPENRRPRWSPQGDTLAYECLIGGHWHICVLDPAAGHERVLTGRDSDAFAPTWSRDGKSIAFINDRDGNDQLFVMRTDGTGVVRLTGGQGDKDTPSWFP